MIAPPLLRVAYTGVCHAVRAWEHHMRNLLDQCNGGAVLSDQPPSEILVQWPRSEGQLRVHARLLINRHDHVFEPIQQAIAEDGLVARDFELLKEAHVVVFLLDGRPHRFLANGRGWQVFQDDIRAGGRRPEDLPVLFLIDRMTPDAPLAIPTSRNAELVHWPRSDLCEGYALENLGWQGALDGAIDLYGEMQTERTHKPPA